MKRFIKNKRSELKNCIGKQQLEEERDLPCMPFMYVNKTRQI